MGQQVKATLQITGMTCAACAARLEKGLSRMPGVQQVSVNLATNKATLSYDQDQVSMAEIQRKISDIGYSGHLADDSRVELSISGMT